MQEEKASLLECTTLIATHNATDIIPCAGYVLEHSPHCWGAKTVSTIIEYHGHMCALVRCYMSWYFVISGIAHGVLLWFQLPFILMSIRVHVSSYGYMRPLLTTPQPTSQALLPLATLESPLQLPALLY